ncbi:hypothetical protein PUNSTDRAFT_139669 [Punctularia strigosozonata HHB-11173 SS5]|uniref:Uncharacterized protein n=1 Tax=Punctularia strigosozonata (strain HHB-11173) TaxID=741275 RepID=R7S0I7_PUNST|nr:uncharacterized protein PUNSTDRAFT_139669 [Punctularia strigosozonata HHB-11173 SS5]EIN03312.1 hypothetical protein PUNSTDRAFT_139669 [Punctularia strigosozonata HHB-11173 SS5]
MQREGSYNRAQQPTAPQTDKENDPRTPVTTIDTDITNVNVCITNIDICEMPRHAESQDMPLNANTRPCNNECGAANVPALRSARVYPGLVGQEFVMELAVTPSSMVIPPAHAADGSVCGASTAAHADAPIYAAPQLGVHGYAYAGHLGMPVVDPLALGGRTRSQISGRDYQLSLQSQDAGPR